MDRASLVVASSFTLFVGSLIAAAWLLYWAIRRFST